MESAEHILYRPRSPYVDRSMKYDLREVDRPGIKVC